MRFDTEQIKHAHRLEDYLPERGIELKGSGPERQGRCPFHEEKTGPGHHGHLYVNVAEQVWHCVYCSNKVGGDVIRFVEMLDNVSFNDACSKLGGKPLTVTGNGHRYKFEELKETDRFVYVDARNVPAKQKIKYLQPNNKPTYIQFAADGKKLPENSAPLLYHLPEVIASSTVWVTEGEKDADNLCRHGIAATTNDAGACNWTDDHTDRLVGKDVIICGDNDPKGREHIEKLKAELSGKTRSLRVVRVPARFKDVSEYLETVPCNDRAKAIADLEAHSAEIIDGMDMSELDACSYDHAHPPEPPVPVFKIKGQVLASTGDLVSVQGQYKAGKSALLSAMIAGGICDENYCGAFVDLLGLECKPSTGKAIIHFDTEQSRHDHDNVVRTAIRRAEMEEEGPPPFLLSYRTRSFRTPSRFPYLCACMERASRDFGGIYFVLIDGICDLFPDVNDATGAEDNVHKLLVLAERYDCSIILVIHENPGTTFGKTRGHLGSELQRKCMSNLKIAKDNVSEIVTVWTEGSRHAHINKDKGIRFKWDKNEGMHTTIAADNAKMKQTDQERAECKDDVDAIFEGHESGLRYAELNKRIEELFGLSPAGAVSRRQKYCSLRVIAQGQDRKYFPRI